MEGLGRIWMDLEGLVRTWEEQERPFKVLKGLERTWRGIQHPPLEGLNRDPPEILACSNRQMPTINPKRHD